MGKRQKVIKDCMLSLLIYVLALLSSMIFDSIGVDEHITTVFVFAVFLISLQTEGYVYGLVSALLAMLAINYAFTYPFYALDFIIPSNLISAVTMTAIAVLTSALTTKIKKHEMIKAESERERMRANLLRAVSHDLRTPLTTIYGSSTALLENNEKLTSQQREMILKGIRDDADWLMRMVENLLSITRIDSGRIKIQKTPMVIDELLDSVITKFKKRYPNQKVELTLPDEIIVVSIDAILIEQVLMNFLENAVLHAEGMQKLSLRVLVKDNKAIFEVEDDGCGISEERLKHIFNRYFESHDDSVDSRKTNTGIGLSVCATIIKAHGGNIQAENAKKGGAVFRFTLDKEEVNDEQ